MSAYWLLQDEKPLTAAGPYRYEYLLTRHVAPFPASGDPLVVDPVRLSSDPFLRESELVQVHAPEVERLLQRLDQYRGLNDRLAVARHIEDLVLSTLPKFDDEAVKEDEIIRLSTVQILQRGSGVCQHYANLFAALARGMGIPTRIISGFDLSNAGAGGHAWNEIEVREGVWLPIDPQIPDLHLVSTWYYLPMSISNSDEFTTVSQATMDEFLLSAMQFDFTPRR